MAITRDATVAGTGFVIDPSEELVFVEDEVDEVTVTFLMDHGTVATTLPH